MLRVLNLRLLASLFGQALSALALTCDDLRWLVLTLVEIKFSRKSMRVFNRLATWPKSAQVEWCPLTYYQPMKYRKCLPWNVFLSLLSTCKETCESVWPGLNSNYKLYVSSLIAYIAFDVGCKNVSGVGTCKSSWYVVGFDVLWFCRLSLWQCFEK